MNGQVIDWLLCDDNPAVKFRTQTELLGQSADTADVKKWICCKLPENWHETKGLWYVYYVTALAQCGLSKDDVPPERIACALDTVEYKLEYSCADFMLLASLVKLGYDVRSAVEKAAGRVLPDGGFLCTRRLNKLGYTPKSCYKADLHALMLLAECKKKNIDVIFGDGLTDYFLRRNIFYRSDDMTSLIMGGREGWRIVDAFHPFETMRIGIHTVVETFSALGYGGDERLREAWDFLYRFRDQDGRFTLSGTLAKSYLPKEKVGKPSKWATFYALLAEKERDNAEKR